MHAEGSATSCLGVPGALGEQAHRRARSGGAHPRTDESPKCARLADVAGLPVAHAEAAALTVKGLGSKRKPSPDFSGEGLVKQLPCRYFPQQALPSWQHGPPQHPLAWRRGSHSTNECCQSNDQKKIFHKVLLFQFLLRTSARISVAPSRQLDEHAARRRNWRTLSTHRRVLIADADTAD